MSTSEFERAVVVGPMAGAVAGSLAGAPEVERTPEGANLVIVAAGEDADLAVRLLGEVAAAVDASTVIAVAASTLPVTDLAAGVPEPGRVAGLHVVDAVPGTTLVEVVRALQTEPSTTERLAGFCTAIGRIAVEVPDRPGFLINNLLLPYLNDVIAEYDAGLANAEDLDTAMELGLGYKLGPLALLDAIGLDTHQHATRTAHEQTRDPQFVPPPLLGRMVAAGYLGNKSGRGFRAGGGLEQ